MIPDAASTLYKLYDLDRSKWGLLKFFLFKGGLGKSMKGMKLFKQKVKQDGHTDRVEAEFLINAEGIIKQAYYGNFPGDTMPISTVRDFIELN